jgi:hypothetical protein
MLFGDFKKRPEPPYVVVKMIATTFGKRAQCYVHDVIGKQDDIEMYCISELPALLCGEVLQNEDVYISVIDTREYFSGLAISTDDNTISAERDFLIPVIY